MSVGDREQSWQDELAQWTELRNFSGETGEFFLEFLQRISALCNASASGVFVRSESLSGSGDSEATAWRCVLSHPRGQPPLAKLENSRLDAIEAVAQADSVFCGILAPGTLEETGLGVVLPDLEENLAALLVLQLGASGADRADELGLRLKLATAALQLYQSERRLDHAKKDISRFASCLDLMTLVNAETRFLSAAMLLCNELSTRFQCDRVSLGWIEGNYIQVKAVSHTEKIEKKMEAVQLLAAAMEEAADQAEEVVLPRPEGSLFVTRDHEIYAKAEKTEHLATLPILEPQPDDSPVAVADSRVAGAVTLERAGREFSSDEVASLRLSCDQAARRLKELHDDDRWFGRRAAAAIRKNAAKLIGVEHTWWKLLGLALSITLAVLLFGKKEYRVEAPFSLETDSIAYLSAPFDGYLDDSLVEVGDAVDENATLFTLDTRELLLQKQGALAEKTRYSGEAVRAESIDDIAGMRIARARLDQAESNLELVEFRLSQSKITAPFQGVVVEGDLDERINAPVEQGDVLMKIAKIAGLYPELKLEENDIHEIEETAAGSIAFASRPELKFPVLVERVEPVARTEEEGNVFIIRCRLDGEDQPEWWRPGMSGIAKINAGKRNLLWIMTHRAVDRLRILLW